MQPSPTIIISLAILGGIGPAMLWLWFWLKEDRLHPEPKALLTRVFLFGGLAVFPTYFIQQFFKHWLDLSLENNLLALILVWATIEEIIKLLVVYLAAWRNKNFDEPIDAMIYLITAALGFAAIENVLFISNALGSEGGKATVLLLTGNFRFIGATLLHLVSSATVGASVGLAFCKSSWKRLGYLIIGLALAIALHSAFNYFIIEDAQQSLWQIFFFLWSMAVFIILLFEKVKNIICELNPQ
jgi:RsiW-degrading membrane proteinase PrsW (M82 family)